MDPMTTQFLGETSFRTNDGCYGFGNTCNNICNPSTTSIGNGTAGAQPTVGAASATNVSTGSPRGAEGSGATTVMHPQLKNNTMNYYGGTNHQQNLRVNYQQRNNNNDDEDAYILTEGFEKLSFTEREQALAQLHGVSDSISENDAMVGRALDDLQSEISKKYSKALYDKALFLNPNYVENRDLRLMFLRGEKFDASKAATKFIKHFEVKMELFGLECLARDITFDDLTEGAKEIYMSGGQWYTNIYDRSGRRICLGSIANLVFRKPIDYLQMFWYNYMVAAEDVRTQRNGVTSVVFAAGDSVRRPLDGATFLQLPKVISAIPVSVGGIHFCYEDKFMAHMYPNPIKVLQWTMDTLTRTKLRVHHGTVMEMKYALLSFGIPADTLPLDPSGKLIYHLFEEFVRQRLMFEMSVKEQMAINNLAACPTDSDVLLGRGRPFQEFSGNLRLNQLVDMHRPAYDAMIRSEKTRTITKIIESVHQYGGRFLRRLPVPIPSESNVTISAVTKMDVDTDADDTIAIAGPGTSSASSCNSYSTAAGWEIVDDITTVHRKVNNIFKTRRNRASSVTTAVAAAQQ